MAFQTCLPPECTAPGIALYGFPMIIIHERVLLAVNMHDRTTNHTSCPRRPHLLSPQSPIMYAGGLGDCTCAMAFQFVIYELALIVDPLNSSTIT